QLVALLEATHGFFAGLVPRNVGQVNQTVDAGVQTDEDTEIGTGLEGAGNAGALVDLAREVFPSGGLEVLDARGDTTTLLVDVQTDEDTEIGNRLDGAGDAVALVELAREVFPWVGLALLDAQGDTTTLFVDVQNHDFHFVADLYDLRRVDVLVGPVHFGNVHQTFDTLFQLGEAAVVGEVGDAGHDAGVFWVTGLDGNPWVFAQLLQTQGDAVALAVELQHLDVDLVANVDDLGRMLDALPGHVGDVQQAVHAAQVDECAVVGEVLDDTLDLLAFLQRFQQRFALGAVLGFQDATTGNDNVVALLVQLDDLEFEFLAFQVSGITHRTDIDQGTWQERTDAVNVDSEAALNLTVDNALDHFLSGESCFQNDPALGTLGFLAGQLGLTEAIFNRVQRNVNFVTHAD